MANELDPLVDQWYRHRDKGQPFCITAINEVSETIEVQHFDGDLEEYSFDEWRELYIELAEEPESWAGSLDISEQDDFGTEVTDTRKRDWTESQQEFPSPELDKLS